MDDINKNSCDELDHTKKGEDTSKTLDSSCVNNNFDSNIKNFQKYLLLIRITLNLTPEQAGKLLGVSRQTVANLELGNTKMSTSQYITIKSLYRLIYIQEQPFSMSLTMFHITNRQINTIIKRGIKNQDSINEIQLLRYFIEDYSNGINNPDFDDDKILNNALERALSLDDIQDYVNSFVRQEKIEEKIQRLEEEKQEYLNALGEIVKSVDMLSILRNACK